MGPLRGLGFVFLTLLLFLVTINLFGRFTLAAPCRDANRLCSTWSRRKLCTTGRNRALVRKVCPYSCGLCTCKDKLSSARCNLKKRLGLCRSKIGADYMSRMCRSTCGMCGWGKWGKWGTCSRSCGRGVRRRSRVCLGAYKCVGASVQQMPCVGTSCLLKPRPSRYRPRPSRPRPKPSKARPKPSKTSKPSTPSKPSKTSKPSKSSNPSKSGTNLRCGAINEPLKIKRIIGGETSHEYKWPWMVGIFKTRTDEYPFCGGTLVHTNLVLTAAHCFDKIPKTLFVRVGDFDVKRKGTHEQIVEVKQVQYHPQYDKKTISNDLAVLTLREHVKLKKEVNVACLPHSKLRYEPGKYCFVTGWGRVKEYGPQADKLQETSVPLVDYDKCNKAYKGKLNDGNICAGLPGGGRDACQGDSGGPLVCAMRDGRYVLTGITSFGAGCGRKGFFGVYTDVRKYVNIIKSVIRKTARG